MRACYALRPKKINWPKNNNNLPSFRLKHLTKANGIKHSNAHNAMANVYATIAMAKLVKTRQPRLFNYLFTHRNKHKLMALINVPQIKPLVHVSKMFGAWRGNTSWVAPLAWHPKNRNAVIMVNLAKNISPLLKLNSNTLRKRLYTAKTNLGNNAAVPVKLMHINKCPVLAQANTLRPKNANQLKINRQHCLNNLKILRKNPQVRKKVVAIFAKAKPFTPSNNVNAQLYNGFFSNANRAAIKIVLKTKPRNLPALNITFVNKQIKKLLFNYQARNFPKTLNYAKQQRWLKHRRQVFTPKFLQGYANKLQMLAQQYANNKKKVALLKALWQYAQKIV